MCQAHADEGKNHAHCDHRHAPEHVEDHATGVPDSTPAATDARELMLATNSRKGRPELTEHR